MKLILLTFLLLSQLVANNYDYGMVPLMKFKEKQIKFNNQVIEYTDAYTKFADNQILLNVNQSAINEELLRRIQILETR